MADKVLPARVWIDLSNSPHVPFFAPVIEELQRRGVPVTLTARDFNQTVEMSREEFGDVDVVGRWGRGLLAKSAAVATRAIGLARYARRRQFTLAVSHNSYSQILAARALGLRTITMMDYEHQPANHLAFRLADVVVVPSVFPDRDLRRLGARNVVRYPGFKEEMYLSRPASSDGLREGLGVGPDEVLVVLRPPPDYAAYHRFDNPLFDQAVEHVLSASPGVALLLPRTPEQREEARRRYGNRVRIPDSPLSGSALLRAADLVVGGGGTMNREAAVLGTPTYSLFAGPPSAVDAALVERGALKLIRDPADLRRIDVARKTDQRALAGSEGRQENAVLETVLSTIVEHATRSPVRSRP